MSSDDHWGCIDGCPIRVGDFFIVPQILLRRCRGLYGRRPARRCRGNSTCGRTGQIVIGNAGNPVPLGSCTSSISINTNHPFLTLPERLIRINDFLIVPKIFIGRRHGRYGLTPCRRSRGVGGRYRVILFHRINPHTVLSVSPILSLDPGPGILGWVRTIG